MMMAVVVSTVVLLLLSIAAVESTWHCGNNHTTQEPPEDHASLPPGDSQDYQKVALQLHNKYRQRHQVGDLILDLDLSARALKCAIFYANGGQAHKCPDKGSAWEVGENIAGAGTSEAPYTDFQGAQKATDMWYEENKAYNYETGKCASAKVCGHFTQLVWKASTKFGFGIKHYTKRGLNWYSAVGLYSPPGNFNNREKDNVFKPK